jgi:histone acetyltransferase (RNA polymerase elongator complex component)
MDNNMCLDADTSYPCPKGKCLYCEKPLRRFTSSVDWKTRHLHKICYKDLMYELDILNEALVDVQSLELSLKLKQRVLDFKKKWKLT